LHQAERNARHRPISRPRARPGRVIVSDDLAQAGGVRPDVTPGSDGCVSMTDADAKMLFDWADVGTPIVIHS
jgi:hypothetical protein